MDMPEPPEHPGHAELPARFRRCEVLESGADVVVIRFEPVRELRFSFEASGVGGRDLRLEGRCVAVSDRAGLEGGVEPIERVLADRLQHPEPVVLRAHQALVYERAEGIQVRVTYGLRRVE